MKMPGLKAHIFLDSFNPDLVIEGGASIMTKPDTAYFVLEKGEGSEISVDAMTFFFSPKTGTQIEVVPGDKIFPIDMERYCKTTADYSAEQGAVDVSDDCDPGASILDGIVSVSGSLSGFIQYDDTEGVFNNATAQVLNKFFNIVMDDGVGGYSVAKRNDNAVYMLIHLNTVFEKTEQFQNWLMIPIRITSISGSLGLADAQNLDISWVKGEGEAGIYQRKIV